jgi:acetate kinase
MDAKDFDSPAPDTAPAHIPVAISTRHVHLTQVTIDRLFGPGHELHVRAPLVQPGQFAAEETVTLIGPRGRIVHVAVVGPPRSDDQVEVSRTDEFTLGIDAPLRESGDLAGTPGLVIEGPAGQVTLDHGVICALRHIHMSPADAQVLGLKNQDRVEVAVQGKGRRLVFGDVIVRVSPDYRLELHLDTDEGNAAGLHAGEDGLLLSPTEGTAALQPRKPT